MSKAFLNLWRQSPEGLKEVVLNQKNALQNPKHHPEGNTLRHIIVVTERAARLYPDDRDLLLAAYFHDLGKYATFEIGKKGVPTAHGHEEVSAELVKEYSAFIKEQKADPETVHFIVSHHMKMKPYVWDVMKAKKKEVLQKDRNFDKLQKFAKIDKGGTIIYLDQNLNPTDKPISEGRIRLVNILYGILKEFRSKI